MTIEKERTPRQWLLDVAKTFNSDKAALAMSRLLDALDAYQIPYVINERVDNCNSDNQSTIVKEIYNIGFDLVINSNTNGKCWLIDASIPVELLGQTEEVPSIGRIASKAYQWLVNEHHPSIFNDNNKRETIDFDAIDAEDRASILKEFDEIVRPVIGDNGFPDWTRPEFIEEVTKK